MGTNYYTRIDECDKCGRHERIHLGKSSAGWQFSFQYNGGRFYKGVKDMKRWLKGKVIKDEYGDVVSKEDFWKMVGEKQKNENMNHARYVKDNYGPETAAHEHIIGGFSFSDVEFS